MSWSRLASSSKGVGRELPDLRSGLIFADLLIELLPPDLTEVFDLLFGNLHYDIVPEFGNWRKIDAGRGFGRGEAQAFAIPLASLTVHGVLVS
jgi:hypothetical protein